MTSRHLMAWSIIWKVLFSQERPLANWSVISTVITRAKNESWDVFANYLHILVRKIIACKPSFRTEGNEQLKHKYTHKLQDQNYAVITHSSVQTSDHMESFTQSHGCLALIFSSHSKLGKISSQATSVETSSLVTSEESQEPRLSKNSWQWQNKIDQQASRISSLEVQNQKLTQHLSLNS